MCSSMCTWILVVCVHACEGERLIMGFDSLILYLIFLLLKLELFNLIG